MPSHSFTSEIVLVVLAIVIHLGGLIFNGRAVWSWMAMGGIIVAVVAILSPDAGLADASNVAGDFTLAVRWIGLALGGLLLVATSLPPASSAAATRAATILMAVLGILLVGRADGLVLSFLGLELVCFAAWALLVFRPAGQTKSGGLSRNGATTGNADRYLLPNVIGAGVLFYGLAFLLCSAGSSQLAVVCQRLPQLIADAPQGPIFLARVGLVLVFAGLGLKIAAPAFHVWRSDADVTGCTVAGILSVVPPAAAMIVLVRVVALGCQPLGPSACRITLLLAMATMTAGNLAAFVQTNPRRLLVFSSLAQAGYLLIGPAVEMAAHSTAEPGWSGIGTLLFGLLVFAAGTIGFFAALGCLGYGGGRIQHVEQLAGLAWTRGIKRPVLAWSMGIILLSLAGLAPLAGFWGRLLTLSGMFSGIGSGSGIQSWLTATAFVCVLNWAVAAVYYVKLVAVIFLRVPLGTPRIAADSEGPFLAAVCSALLILVVGIYPGAWVNLLWISGPPWP